MGRWGGFTGKNFRHLKKILPVLLDVLTHLLWAHEDILGCLNFSQFKYREGKEESLNLSPN